MDRHTHMRLSLPPSQYAELVENSPVLVWRSGPDAQCDYFNGTWLRFTGRAISEELGDGWTRGVHSEDNPRRVDTYRDHFRRRVPFEMEYRLRRHDGAYRWILDHGVPIREGGEFRGFLGSCIDVHERHESQEARESFLRMMGHELRTPLQAIKMLVEAMRRGAAAGEACTPEMFDRLQAQCDRFGRLTGDLSQTADLGVSMRKARLNLAGLLQRVVESRSDTLRGAPGRRRHQFLFRGPSAAEVEGDEQRLEQALQNVIDNAVKFSPRGGAVEVTLQSTNGAHRIAVRDEGVGIPRDELSMVSGRFFRASNVPQHNFPGVGLGLAAARDIVEKHGGSLDVASQLGRGTEVTIVIPPAPESGL